MINHSKKDCCLYLPTFYQRTPIHAILQINQAWGCAAAASSFLPSFLQLIITFLPHSTFAGIQSVHWPNCLLTHPEQLLCLMVSNGVFAAALRLQIRPTTHEMIARTVSMEITPRNGPIDPEDCQPLDDVDADATASGLATAASPAGCCCPGKVGDEGNIVAIAKKCVRVVRRNASAAVIYTR